MDGEARSEQLRTGRRAGLSVGLLVASVCALLSTGHIEGLDGTVMFRLSEAMVVDGTLASRPADRQPAFGGQPAPAGPDGSTRIYVKYGLGTSLVMVPMVALAELALPLAGEGERQIFETGAVRAGRAATKDPTPVVIGDPRCFRRLWYDTREFGESFRAFAASLSSAILIGVVAALVVVLALELGAGLAGAATLGVLLTLGTPLFHYSGQVFSEVLATALLLEAARALLAVQRGDGGAARAGLMLGCIGLAKVALLTLGAPLLVALALACPERAKRNFFWFFLGMGPPLALALAYNYARFGTLLETGYGQETADWTTPALEGFLGLLLSPGRGFFLHFPLAVPCLLLLRPLAERSRALAVLAGGSLLTLVLLYCRWWSWEGGWSWGPRFLLPTIPLLGLALATTPRQGLPWRVVLGAAVLGLVPALSGMVLDQHDYMQWLRRYAEENKDYFMEIGLRDYYPLLRWDLMFSPLVAAWTEDRPRTLILLEALRQPGLVLGVLAAFGLAGAAGLARLIGALRAVYRPQNTRAEPMS